MIFILTVLLTLNREVLNSSKATQLFNRTEISTELAQQINHQIVNSVDIPLNNVEIVNSQMVKQNADKIIENGFNNRELVLSNKTINDQIKQALLNHQINSSILNLLVNRISPTITSEINRKINTKKNRTFFNRIVVLKRVTNLIVLISIILIIINFSLALLRKQFLRMLGYSGIVSGILTLIMIFFNDYFIDLLLVKNSLWLPLTAELKQLFVNQFMLLAVVELVVSGIGLFMNRLMNN